MDVGTEDTSKFEKSEPNRGAGVDDVPLLVSLLTSYLGSTREHPNLVWRENYKGFELGFPMHCLF